MAMRAPPAPPRPAMAPMPPTSMRTPPAPMHHNLLLLPLVHQRHDPRHKEKHTIHNPQREARLEHRTRLIHAQPHRRQGAAAKRAQVDIDRRVAGHDGDAVRVCDEAQLVDAGDEGADEGEVDEADEARVVAVREDGEEGPGQGEDRDDEEEEDVGRRKLVGGDVEVDEVGEHAHYWDLFGGAAWLGLGGEVVGGGGGRIPG